MDTSSSEAILVFASEAEAVQSILKALQSYEHRIIQLEEESTRKSQIIEELRQSNDLRALEIAQDRQRLAKLEYPAKVPGQTAQDRAARLDHYMDARPDHKASYEALKGFLGISDVLLNAAIAALKREHPGKYGTAKDTNDKRKRILAVIPKIS